MRDWLTRFRREQAETLRDTLGKVEDRVLFENLTVKLLRTEAKTLLDSLRSVEAWALDFTLPDKIREAEAKILADTPAASKAKKLSNVLVMWEPRHWKKTWILGKHRQRPTDFGKLISFLKSEALDHKLADKVA